MKELDEQALKYAFYKVFSSDYAEVVLAHLAKYAHADDADFCDDPRRDAYYQGRRSVILEIRKMLTKQDES